MSSCSLRLLLTAARQRQRAANRRSRLTAMPPPSSHVACCVVITASNPTQSGGQEGASTTACIFESHSQGCGSAQQRSKTTELAHGVLTISGHCSSGWGGVGGVAVQLKGCGSLLTVSRPAFSFGGISYPDLHQQYQPRPVGPSSGCQRPIRPWTDPAVNFARDEKGRGTQWRVHRIRTPMMCPATVAEQLALARGMPVEDSMPPLPGEVVVLLSRAPFDVECGEDRQRGGGRNGEAR